MKPSPSINHPVHSLIRKRWSPRSFADRPVEGDKINSLFEATRWAASSMNEQPWRFIYATKSETDLYNKLFDCLAEGNKTWVKSAPLLIMTLMKPNHAYKNMPNKWAMHDLGLAIGNLTLQATSMDLYIHNIAGFSVNKAKKNFNIPSQFEPVTMIAVGYLGNPDQLPNELKNREVAQQERKQIDELILI